jgi:hypothetical protein
MEYLEMIDIIRIISKPPSPCQADTGGQAR